MSAAHTPGPWQVGHFDADMICDSDGDKRGCAPIARVEGTRSERKHNARLIAVAPELLAELQEILVWAKTEKAPLRQQEIESIQRLIDKATGGQP